MNYFCTHSDKNYLAKGITLFQSLLKNVRGDFRLYYLCLDDETYKVIYKLSQKREFEQLKPIPINAFDVDDLKTLRNLPKSNYGDEYSQFCWALTPYFTWWLLNKELPEGADLLYCDADLYFYHDAAIIISHCVDHSVGIHRHRFRTYDINTNDVGEFNVGCIYFKNNTIGRSLSVMWKFLLMNPNNIHAKQFGTCGDQKYWDWLYYLSGQKENICVFDPDNGKIAHGAPWNFNLYQYTTFGNVEFDGRPQLLIFNHFSHFKITEKGWQSSNHGEWKPEDGNEGVNTYYNHYYGQVKQTIELVKELGFDI